MTGRGRYVERWLGPAVLTAFALVMLLGIRAQAVEQVVVEGAGATFPAPLYARWISLFEREHDADVVYDAVGSGDGIEAITEREVAFGASDALLDDEELAAQPGEVVEIPTTIGAVVLAHNLSGLGDDLVLDGPTVADIYLGHVERWDDPAIAALNPDLDLPGEPIRVTHRSDSSGTTFVFTDYLSAVSDEWAEGVGRGKEVDWPVDDHAGRGNDGVAQQVLVRRGGIGYIEHSYADITGLDHALIVNRAGRAVGPETANVQAALAAPRPTRGRLTPESVVDAPGSQTYPLAAFTYLIVPRDLDHVDHDTAEALVDFLRWALRDGQDEATDVGYAPLPPALADEALALVDSLALPAGD